MVAYVKQGGAWKPVTKWVRASGSWSAPDAYAKVGGEWRLVRPLKPFSYEYIGRFRSDTSGSTQSAPVELGDTDPSRIILAMVNAQGGSGNSTTSVSLGGVEPDSLWNVNAAWGAKSTCIALWNRPDGDAATLSLTYAASKNAMRADIVAIYGATLAGIVYGNTYTNNSATTPSRPVEAPANSLVFGLVASDGSSSYTWSNGTELADSTGAGTFSTSARLHTSSASYTLSATRAGGSSSVIMKHVVILKA